MTQATVTQRSLTARYEAEFPNSRKLFEKAKNLFPNGVTHDLRHLEPFPIYIERAEGAHKWDVDGHRLSVNWAANGAWLLGTGHPRGAKASRRQMAKATNPGPVPRLESDGARCGRRLG